jgi:RNA polymerase sigma-70 factor (ECF subfamily)
MRAVCVADADILFTQHRQGVFRYVCRIVGQVETAHDLTQEVFLRVARSPVPEADAAGRRAWVFKIARNLVLNHLRDGRRRIVTESAEMREAVAPAVQELAVALRQALDALQPLDRDVFLLRETAGLSYEEIGAACDITVEAVRARLHRARQDLRASLDGPVRVRRGRPVSFNGRQGDES